MNKEVFLHKHICLVEDHYNPLGIVRSLGEEGIKPIVLLCSPHPRLVLHSKYIGELYTFNTIEEGFEYMVNHYGNEEKKPFVYNGSDDITLLLDKHYEELKDHFYFTNGQGGLEKYLQKYDACVLAEECGIRIPKEELLEVGTLPTTLRYPVITKAATSSLGSWKDQSFICEDEKSLKEAYSQLKVKTILVQEYIRKKNELCIDGISINGGDQVFMPYGCGYHRMKPGSYGNYMYFNPFIDKDLTEKINKLVKGMKFSGIFCIEFLVGEDGGYYFLEINLRNSGWSYAFTYGGFNLPFRWAVSTLDNNLYLEDFKALAQFDAMQEDQDLHDCLKVYHISPLKWYKDFHNCECCLIYNKKDPKPFRKYLLSEISRLTKKFVFRIK